jgi:glutaminase
MVIPNVAGICTFSPPLDYRGNSVRGLEFGALLSARYGLHIFSQFLALDMNEQLEFRQQQQKWRADEAAQVAKGAEAKVNMLDLVRIMNACADGNLKALVSIVATLGLSIIDVCDYDKRTPLHVAASEGRHEVVEFLLQKGAKHDVVDRFGLTPREDAGSDRTEEVFARFLTPKDPEPE